MVGQAVTVPWIDRRWVISVGELGEFGLVARITERLTRPSPSGPRTGPGEGRGTAPAGPGSGPARSGTGPAAPVPLGPGDDAAVVAAPDGRVVATTDLLVERRHFRLDWSAPYDIGRKAAAQNLADVAAMGARPTALLTGLGLPPGTAVAWVDGLVDGLRDEAAVTGAAVVGGDIVRADQIMVAVTALGDLGGRAPLTRSDARPGDVVAVAGRLGHAAAGEELLRRGVSDPPGDIVAAHRRPCPPYGLGPAAALLGATALVDVSDGLVQDLGHIAAASGVWIDLDGAALPIPESLVKAAELTGSDPRRFVLTGGEDHALAGTFPAGTELRAPWMVIGKVRAGENGVTVDGRTVERGGWDHFG